jgi:hypothetical protein
MDPAQNSENAAALHPSNWRALSSQADPLPNKMKEMNAEKTV